MITAPTPFLDSIRTLHKKGCQSHCQYKQGRLYTCVDATLSRDCHRLPSKADSMIKLYASRPLNTFWFFRNVFILIRIYLKWNEIYVTILERRCRNASFHLRKKRRSLIHGISFSNKQPRKQLYLKANESKMYYCKSSYLSCW